MRYTKKRIYSWSSNIAYLVGLMASDGSLSKDGRHLDMTSVDIEQLKNFNIALGREVKISEKKSGAQISAYRIQFSDVALYDFLISVGLTPNKSKSIGSLRIPNDFFSDFLRGLYDGDGSSYAFWDARWKSSYMFYTGFTSASKDFIEYLQGAIVSLAGASRGSVHCGARACTLRFAKKDSRILYDFMYYSPSVICLSRKRNKLESFIGTDNAAKM